MKITKISRRRIFDPFQTLLRLFISVFSLILWSNIAAASPTPLNWQQCLNLLKNNNADLKSAELTFQSTESLETGAFSGYYPSLSGGLGYNQSSTSLGSTSDFSSLYSASLTLSQSVFAGMKDYYKTAQAKASTRIAKATLQIAKAKISYDFINAYESFLSAQENLKLSESIVARRQEDLRLVELRFESGRENKGSVLLSEAYLAQAKYENIQARHSQISAKTALAQVLGISEEALTELSDPTPIQAPPSNPRLQELAMMTPEHQEILSTLDANMAAIGIARSTFFPTLSLTGSVGRNSPEFFPQNDRWSIGASINIPIFDGGRDYSSVNSASLIRDSSLARKISVDQGGISALQLAYQKFVEAVEKLKVDESFQTAAVLRSRISREQYNNGLISFTDWDLIETDLINRQKNFVQSKKDRILSEAAWNQAQGAGVLP